VIGKTHLAAGIAVGAAVCLKADLALAPGLICLAGAGLGSLIPDIDQRNSTISKAAKPVGAVVNTVIGHRTLLHDPVLYIALGALCSVMKPEWLIYVMPILLGVASHLLLDSLNPSGIPVLYAVHGPRVNFAFIHTGSKADRAIGLMLTIAGRLAVVVWIGKDILRLI